MQAQRFTLLVSVLALLIGVWSRPLEAAPTQPPSSFPRFSYPDYDLRAQQEEERHLQHEQAVQRHVIAQKRRLLRSRLRQQKRVAKEAAARQCLAGPRGVCSRLVQIDRAYAQKHAHLERSIAQEQAQREAALALERNLSYMPD